LISVIFNDHKVETNCYLYVTSAFIHVIKLLRYEDKTRSVIISIYYVFFYIQLLLLLIYYTLNLWLLNMCIMSV